MHTFSKLTGCFVLGLICLPAQAAIPSCIFKYYATQDIQAEAVDIKAPAIAEDGAVVSISVESVATVSEHNRVEEISFFNEFNATPIATFKLGAQTQPGSLKTRFRLRESSHVYAIAKLADGKLLAGERYIKVTIPGCGGGGLAEGPRDAVRVCAN